MEVVLNTVIWEGETMTRISLNDYSPHSFKRVTSVWVEIIGGTDYFNEFLFFSCEIIQKFGKILGYQLNDLFHQFILHHRNRKF